MCVGLVGGSKQGMSEFRTFFQSPEVRLDPNWLVVTTLGQL